MTQQSKPVRIALIGAGGMLAGAVKAAAPASTEVVGLDLPEFDLTRSDASGQLLALHPDILINCAAFTQVDRCEEEEETALRINGTAVGLLADAAKRLDATLVHISTDYVFAGDKGAPYVETDAPRPLSAYGRTKLAGEQALTTSGLQRYYLLRTSWLYGSGGPNFVETILRLAGERKQLRIVDDQIGSPTLTLDLATAIFRLLAIDDPAARAACGLYHFANRGQCSWYEFACAIVDTARQSGMALAVEEIVPITTADYPLPAARPACSVLATDKYRRATGADIPGWRESLTAYFMARGQG